MYKIHSCSAEMSHEYCATVVRLGEVKPIENTDFLGVVKVLNLDIVVRRDKVREGDVMIYVSNECQLSKEFLSRNNEFREEEYNSNYLEVTAEKNRMREAGATEEEIEAYAAQNRGYFSKNGRVRMKQLRGVMSMGYLISPLQMFNYNGKLAAYNWEECIGDDFDTVDGELFVKAFVPEVKEPQGKGKGRAEKKLKKFNRMIPGQFAFHYDTEQLQRNMTRFTPETSVSITTKVHGCVDENTIINTDHGDFTIKEIVEKKLPYKIKAYDIENNKEVYVNIDEYYMVPNDGEWYEIELENGKTIIITGNNPIWLPNLHCYRRTDELKIGDVVLIS